MPGGAPQKVAQAIQNQGYKTGGGTFSGVGSAGTPTPGSNPFLTVKGFVPDYKGLIQNDPIFSQLRSDLSAQGIGDAASRQAFTQRAIAQFGLVPDTSQLAGLNQEFLSSDLDANTRALAETNTASGMSIAARQQKQFQDQVRAIKNALASRGALRSGEAGHQLQKAQTEFDTARFDTTQELLDYLVGVQQGFVAAERARQQQASQGAGAAMQRQLEINPAQPDREIGPVGPGGRYVYTDTGEPTQNISYNDLGVTPSAITGPSVGPYANNPAGRPQNVQPPNANELLRMLRGR